MPVVVEMSKTGMTPSVILGEAMDKMVIKTLKYFHKTVIYVFVKNLMDDKICNYNYLEIQREITTTSSFERQPSITESHMFVPFK